MAPRAKPKTGDVFEVTLCDERYAYLQMVCDSGFGDVVRVLPGRFRSAREEVASLVDEPHEYMMFADLRNLVREGHAVRVANCPVPAHGAWTGLRYVLIYGRSGKIDRRVLSDGHSAVEQVAVLPPGPERRSVPLWWIGPGMDVVYHLVASSDRGLEPGELEEWKRKHGILDPESGAGSSDSDEGGTRHFAVFPKGARLDGVIAELRQQGFDAEAFDNPGVEGRLLVITAPPSRTDSVNSQWDQVAGVVEAAGGEYDGWEATVN